MEKEVGTATLGTPTVPLLVLRWDPALAPRDPRSAGLFHTAFLLPGRADLARWLAFARDTGVRIEGASAARRRRGGERAGRQRALGHHREGVAGGQLPIE